jgi:hypothetical protein
MIFIKIICSLSYVSKEIERAKGVWRLNNRRKQHWCLLEQLLDHQKP